MSKALSRSIALSDCSEPLQHGVIILCPARARREVIHSKALLLAETPPQAAEVGPSPRDKAVAFIVPEAVLTTDDDEDDDFQVTFSFGLWCHCTDSSCGLSRMSEPRTNDHGRGEALAVANSS